MGVSGICVSPCSPSHTHQTLPMMLDALPQPVVIEILGTTAVCLDEPIWPEMRKFVTKLLEVSIPSFNSHRKKPDCEVGRLVARWLLDQIPEPPCIRS